MASIGVSITFAASFLELDGEVIKTAVANAYDKFSGWEY